MAAAAMAGGFGRGFGRALGLAFRVALAPALIAMRWARAGAAAPELPLPHWDLRLASKVALDEIFFATELVSGAVVSLRDHRRVIRELGEAAELYESRGWIDAPEGYHQTPPALEEAQLLHARCQELRYQRLAWASGFEPHAGEPGRARWLGYAANRTAHAWLLQHPGPPRPWLLCVPGYRMGRPTVDFAGFRARWLHRRLGLNVAIPVLPLHGPRRIGRRGGDGFFSGDFLDTIHAQAQAIWDIRRLVGWLRRQGAPRVGAYGVSLGGYTTALLASVEGDLDCAIAGNPATDFLRLVLRHTPSFLIQAARRAGFAVERLGRVLRVVSPLALPPRVPHERRYLHAGLGDRLTPPEHAHALWLHWERPRVAWYQGSHISFLWEREVRALLQEALAESGLLPPRDPD